MVVTTRRVPRVRPPHYHPENSLSGEGRMTKTFVVEADHDVLAGRVWHGQGLLVPVEPDERVEIYVVVNGKRGACIGAYAYGALNVEAPPRGLRRPADRQSGKFAA